MSSDSVSHYRVLRNQTRTGSLLLIGGRGRVRDCSRESGGARRLSSGTGAFVKERMKPSFNMSFRDDVGRHRSEFPPLTRLTRELFDAIGDNGQFIWSRSYSAGNSS